MCALATKPSQNHASVVLRARRSERIVRPLAGQSCGAGSVSRCSVLARQVVKFAKHDGEHADGIVGCLPWLGSAGIAGGSMATGIFRDCVPHPDISSTALTLNNSGQFLVGFIPYLLDGGHTPPFLCTRISLGGGHLGTGLQVATPIACILATVAVPTEREPGGQDQQAGQQVRQRPFQQRGAQFSHSGALAGAAGGGVTAWSTARAA